MNFYSDHKNADTTVGDTTPPKPEPRLVTEAVKEGLEQTRTLGEDLLLQGINILIQTAINKGVPAENISNIARRGAHTVVDRLGTVADKRIDEIATRIDDRIRGSPSCNEKRRRFCTNCGKDFGCRQSLCRHRKTCKDAKSKKILIDKPTTLMDLIDAA